MRVFAKIIYFQEFIRNPHLSFYRKTEIKNIKRRPHIASSAQKRPDQHPIPRKEAHRPQNETFNKRMYPALPLNAPYCLGHLWLIYQSFLRKL